ncbi:protein of unknown function [Pseudomonas mediterranea]
MDDQATGINDRVSIQNVDVLRNSGRALLGGARNSSQNADPTRSCPEPVRRIHDESLNNCVDNLGHR